MGLIGPVLPDYPQSSPRLQVRVGGGTGIHTGNTYLHCTRKEAVTLVIMVCLGIKVIIGLQSYLNKLDKLINQDRTAVQLY